MFETVPENWSRSADAVVAEILDSTGVVNPPVDALTVAERLGVDVVMDGSQAGRARHKRMGGRSSIFLRPDDRPERLEWAAAHELGEVVAWRVAERAGESDDLPAGLREDVANLVASRLLLPSPWFKGDVRCFDFDLRRLKARYRTASHELIAMRLLDLKSPGIVTVFDNARMTRRRWNGTGRPPAPAEIETRCRRDAHKAGTSAEATDGLLQVRAWAVHEREWKREIVYAAVLDVDDW